MSGILQSLNMALARGPAGSQTLSAQGAQTFTVPSGIYNLNVAYPTPTGMASKVKAVTPGQVLSANIGGFGVQSNIDSIVAPAFSHPIFAFSGNVDGSDWFSLRVGSASGANYSGSGQRATHVNGCAAVGVSLNEYSEVGHGDLVSAVQVDTVPDAVLLNALQVVGIYSAGRYQVNLIQQQPAAGNGYVATWTPQDPGSSEGYYAYTIYLQQIVPLIITW